MATGTTYKQCGCRNEETGKLLGKTCPRLRRGRGWSSDHGSWYYQLELPRTSDGTRRSPLRRGGFPSLDAAQTQLQQARELLAIATTDDPETRSRIADLIVTTIKQTRTLPDPQTVRRKVRTGQDLIEQITVADWLADWLAGKKKLTPSTARSYESHIRLYLTPVIGQVLLDRLRIGHVAAVFEAIDELNDTLAELRATGDRDLRTRLKYRRPVGPATKHRIRATLRSALNAAIRQRKMDLNPAALIELPKGKRPKALVWTDARLAQWRYDRSAQLAAAHARRGGRRVNPVEVYLAAPRPSPVMVWTPTQTGQFLDTARAHRLYALFHLIAFRGLRRGEACGLRWHDLDLDSGIATVQWQIVQLGWTTIQG